MIELIKKELKEYSNKEKAKILQKFFKTGKGEYGEGDIFLGVNVPDQRKIAKKFIGLPLMKISLLLKSKIHEERLTGALILVQKYEKANEDEKANIVNFYLKNSKCFNNWDLVDLSAPKILGKFLINKEKKIIYSLSKSENIWEKRIAIVSTYSLIKENKFEDTLEISKILLQDAQDLIQKAVGWMLREVGKRNIKELKKFLEENKEKMSRTTLRYSIEKFNEKERKKYLSKYDK